jgi:hypothetical protein
MSDVQFFLLLLLLAGNTLLQWMRFAVAWHANKRDFNKFAMDIDRFMDGDETVRAKLLNLEKKAH